MRRRGRGYPPKTSNVIECVLVLALAAVQPGSLELTIEQAVDIGMSGSFRVQRSRRNERIAEERVRGTKAELGPLVEVGFSADQSQRYYNFQGTYDYNRQDPQFDAALGASASYDFDISSIRKRQLRQVQLGKEAGAVDVAQTTIDVAAEIRADYVQALRAQEQLNADFESLALLDSLIDRARISQPTTVGFLESERSNAGLALEQSRQNADLIFSNLRQVLRLDGDRPLNLTSSLPNPAPLPGIDRLLSIADENRSDLKQSEIRLKQARIAKIQAMDSRRPSLRASLFANQAVNGDTVILGGENHGRTRSAGVLISFNLPIFTYDGGQLASNRNIASIQAEQAVADAEEAKERAGIEIRQELIALTAAQERLKRLPDVEQARQALSEAEQQMLEASPKEAAGMLAQVTNARQNWKTSLVSRIDALSSYYASYYRLQHSLGTEQVQ
jgi:outer membrane protein TolC